VYGHLSVRENVDLFARLSGLSDAAGSAGAVLELVGLEDEDRRASELSVGNQQRLNLALAFLGDPDVLLLDEPSASLDPGQRRRLWEVLLDRRAHGRTAIVATHSLEEADRLASRVLLLVDGAVVRDGSAEEIATALEAW
jgi:ABC-type multidrug transport system ATPase subunit